MNPYSPTGRTMPKQVDEAHPLDVEPALPDLHSIPVDVADRFELSPSLEAGVAGLLPLPQDGWKKTRKAFVQATESLFLVEGADEFELVGLIGVASVHPGPSPGFPPFPEGVVVDLAVDLQNAAKGFSLPVVGVETELVAQQYLFPSLGLDVAAYCLRRDLPGNPDVVGTDP